MKTRDEIIQTLGGLADSDRTWIIDRLPAALRSALVAVPEERKEPEIPVKSLRSDESELNAANPEAIAAVLAGEPAWVAHAYAQSRSWGEVRDRLPASIRTELQMLEKSGVRYSRKLIESIELKLAVSIAKPVGVVGTPLNRFLTRVGARLSSVRTNRKITA